MNLTTAAWKLDQIRNERTTTDAETLLKRVDEIGYWLAKQKNGKTRDALLSECHELFTRLAS